MWHFIVFDPRVVIRVGFGVDYGWWIQGLGVLLGYDDKVVAVHFDCWRWCGCC